MQLLFLNTLFGLNGVIVDMENPKTIKIHVQHHNMKLYKYLRQIFFTWHNRHVLWNYIVSVIPSSYLSFADTYNHYFSSWPFKTQTQRMLLLIQIDSECCQIYKSVLDAVRVCVVWLTSKCKTNFIYVSIWMSCAHYNIQLYITFMCYIWVLHSQVIWEIDETKKEIKCWVDNIC